MPSEFDRREFLRRAGMGAGALAVFGPACAQVKQIPKGFTGSESTDPNTLTFSHGPDDSGTVVGLVDKFNKDNKAGVTVEYREVPADSGQYFDKLRTEFQAGGGGIDVMSIDIIWPAQFGANGWIEDLSNQFGKDAQSDFVDASIQGLTWDGKIWGVPWFTDAGMLFYRKDLLEKSGINAPPTTWDELLEMAEQVAGESKTQYGLVFQGAEYEGCVTNGLEYVWGAGGDVLDPNDPGKVLIGGEESAAGLEAMARNVSSGVAPKAVATYKEMESVTAFIQGKSVFMRNWPFAYGMVAGGKETGSSIKPEQVDVVPIPVLKDGESSFSCAGGWNLSINARIDDNKKDAAWEFIQFMTSAEAQSEMAEKASLLPPRKALYEDDELLKKQPAVALAKEVVDKAKPRPQHPFYSDMSLAMAQRFNDVIKGQTDPGDAAKELGDELGRIARAGQEVFDL